MSHKSDLNIGNIYASGCIYPFICRCISLAYTHTFTCSVNTMELCWNIFNKDICYGVQCALYSHLLVLCWEVCSEFIWSFLVPKRQSNSCSQLFPSVWTTTVRVDYSPMPCHGALLYFIQQACTEYYSMHTSTNRPHFTR